MTAGLLALALQELGVNARSWLGWQIPIRTDGVHGKARIDGDRHRRDRAPHGRGAGRGRRRVSGHRRPTAASRRWAAAAPTPRRWRWRRRSKADRCDIFTDVDGVYTTDPRIVAKARKLDKITYEEMLEMASQGAKVLQTRSVEMAMNHRVRVQVLSSFTRRARDARRRRGRDRGKASRQRHRLQPRRSQDHGAARSPTGPASPRRSSARSPTTRSMST